MGVFFGGRTIESLEEVCAGGGIEPGEILDLVQQLVDKSLVTVERDPQFGSRFTFIESVWHYSREKLEASGEADSLRDRHLEYFLTFAEGASPHLEAPEQKAWLDKFQREAFNIRAASDWAIRSGKVEAGCRILVAAYRAIEVRGNLHEAWQRVERLLKLNHDAIPREREAAFLLAAGRLAWATDQYGESRRYLVRAREVYSGLSDEIGASLALALEGFLDRGEGLVDSAESNFQRAAETARLHRGEFSRARELKERGLEILQRHGDYWLIGLSLWGIVQVTLAQKDFDRLRSALDEWVRITRELGNRWVLPYILDLYGFLAVECEQPQLAARRFGAAEAQRRHFDIRFSRSEQAQHDSYLARLRQMLEESALRREWEAGANSSPESLLGEPAEV
jgi:tetratricopeptide (TPR) repeat protein